MTEFYIHKKYYKDTFENFNLILILILSKFNLSELTDKNKCDEQMT